MPIQRKGRELPADKHPNVPKEAKWLSGQGEGTWFTVTKEDGLADNEYRIRRHTPQGNLDCDRVFSIDDISFDITQPFEIAHVSHCAVVKTNQADQVYSFTFKKEF